MTMAEIGKYDSNLHMFILPPAAPDMRRLGFLRWLADRGKLEHWSEAPPSGPLAEIEAAEPVAA